MLKNGLKRIYQVTKQKYSDRFKGCKFHQLTSPDEEGSEEYYLAEHSSAKKGGFAIMKIQVGIKIEWYISMISQGIVIQFFLVQFSDSIHSEYWTQPAARADWSLRMPEIGCMRCSNDGRHGELWKMWIFGAWMVDELKISRWWQLKYFYFHPYLGKIPILTI